MAERKDGGVISGRSSPAASPIQDDHVPLLPVPGTVNTTIANRGGQVRELVFSYQLEHIICVEEAAPVDVL